MPFDRQVEITQMNYSHAARPSLRSPQEERYQIYALKRAGHKQAEIAELLERSKSTNSRELARNRGGRGYRPRQAQCMADDQRAMNARTIDYATWQFARARLQKQWSPEKISGHADISTETVYQRVYADKHSGGLL
jgi:transposase, IS30 family